MTYPVELRQQPDSVLVFFPDSPEALTEGDTRADALCEAKDCLIAALGGYILAGRPVPTPSATPADATVCLPPVISGKLALYNTMLQRGIDSHALARKLGETEVATRCLIDLDHQSDIGQIERALRAFSSRA